MVLFFRAERTHKDMDGYRVVYMRKGLVYRLYKI